MGAHRFATFSLFQSHIDMAHDYWRRLVAPGDTVIDATCGNGHDTLILSKLAFEGTIWAIDIQSEAISATKALLEDQSSTAPQPTIHYWQGCHNSFPDDLSKNSVKLVVYNLGYLPKGDKTITTTCEVTLASIKAAQELLLDGGAISITCYPGHPEGKKEQSLLLEYSQGLPPHLWSCCHHCWTNRRSSPTLLLIQKKANL